MAKLNSLVQLNINERIKVLDKLGYIVNEKGNIVNKSTKKGLKCKYGGDNVHINTAAILPGSLLIINATPLTMAEYFVEYS